jgi:hypothetical protein
MRGCTRGAWIAGLALAAFGAILAARAQWSTGDLWPSTAVYRLPPEPFASNAWATWYHSTSFVYDVAGGTTNGWTNQWLRDIQVDRKPTNLWLWWQSPAGATNWAETNGLTAYDPEIDEWVVTQVTSIAATFMEWGETNLVLTGGANDRMAWEGYEAGFERYAAVFGYALSTNEEGYSYWTNSGAPYYVDEEVFVVTNTTYATNLHRRVDVQGPTYYRDERDAVIAGKALLSSLAPYHVIQSPSNGYATLEAWSEANPTSSFPPMWTAAGLVASNGLPTNWLSSTPWRYLHGEGTNVRQWQGVVDCLNCLVLTKAEGAWSTTNAHWNSARADSGNYDSEGFANETYGLACASALSNGPTVAALPYAMSANVGVQSYGFWSTEWPDRYPPDLPHSTIVGFHADAVCGRGRIGTGTVASLRAAAVEIYARASLVGDLDWGGDDVWPTNGAWKLAASVDAGAAGVDVQDDWVGHESLSRPGFAPEPPTDTNESPAFTSSQTNTGYQLSNPILIFDHRVEGGHRFQ